MRTLTKVGILLGLATSFAYAQPGDRAITEDLLSVTAPQGEVAVGANKLEINYSYLLTGPRDLIITYNIDGSDCHDQIKLVGKQGVSIKDKVTINCNLPKAGSYKTGVELCSFDGDVQKACAQDDAELIVRQN